MNQTYDLEKIITAAASLTERIATGDFADADLGGHLKTGQRGTLQNRPTELGKTS